MSATAFQRRRRELARQKEMKLKQEKATEEIEQVNGTNKDETEKDSDLEELSKNKIKALLDEKGIEYNSKAKKDELIKLLKSE